VPCGVVEITMNMARSEESEINCHAGFTFTDEGYHNTGVAMDRENLEALSGEAAPEVRHPLGCLNRRRRIKQKSATPGFPEWPIRTR
jgi:hypothetical protein